jgi:hypothetical protein
MSTFSAHNWPGGMGIVGGSGKLPLDKNGKTTTFGSVLLCAENPYIGPELWALGAAGATQ